MAGPKIIITATPAPDHSPIPPERALVPLSQIRARIRERDRKQLRDFVHGQAVVGERWALPTVPIGRHECAGGAAMCGRYEVCRATTWALGYCLSPYSREKAFDYILPED